MESFKMTFLSLNRVFGECEASVIVNGKRQKRNCFLPSPLPLSKVQHARQDASDLEAGRNEHGRIRDNLTAVPSPLYQHHGQHRHRGRSAPTAPHQTRRQGRSQSSGTHPSKGLRQTQRGSPGEKTLRDQRTTYCGYRPGPCFGCCCFFVHFQLFFFC